MLSILKPSIESYTRPVAKYLVHVNQNVLTLLGSIPSVLFFVFVIYKFYIWALIFYLGTLLDLLDGVVARMHGKVTPFGGFFDSTMDRISDFLVIGAFGFGHIVRWEIVVPLLLASFLVSYTRSRGELAS